MRKEFDLSRRDERETFIKIAKNGEVRNAGKDQGQL